MIATGQSKKAQAMRIANGCCPVHGVGGVPIGCRRKRVILECPRRDCTKRFYEPNDDKLLDEIKNEVDRLVEIRSASRRRTAARDLIEYIQLHFVDYPT